MKKLGALVVIVLITVFLLSISQFVLAEEDSETNEIQRAYDCLDEKVEDNCESIGLDAQSFSLLAIGECKSELEDESYDDNTCWPAGGCQLTETGIALWALNRNSGNTDDAEEWLLSQKKIPDDLTWFLEIDSSEEIQCDLTYGSVSKSITIKEDKTITGNAGSCLSRAWDNYWLEIDEDCYDENFTISCDKSFISTLLYKKKEGVNKDTIYVSGQTESSSGGGTTEHTVNSYCFSTTSSCDYEGSLWATFALSKTGNDISGFLPYLIAMADEPVNSKYLPSAFLLILTDDSEYLSTLINKQNSEGYWQMTDSNKRYYDTALALLSLYGVDTNTENTETWLFDTQGDSGCWRDDIVDTSFILYALSPKSVSSGGGGGDEDCEEHGKFCESSLDCDQGDLLPSFDCYGGKFCCEVKSEDKTCDERGGIVCSSDQTCTGATVSDDCCLGSCITQEENACEENAGYYCRFECSDDEEEKDLYSNECTGGDICCGPEIGGKSYWWIWLLVILIILLVLAIIFRNQLKIWFFRIKNKFKKGPGPARAGPRGPGFPRAPPGAGARRGMPRMILPFQQRRPPGRRPARPIRRAISKTDRELDATLKKLKDMAK